MPTPTLITILDPAALLERAVDGLFPLRATSAERPWPTLDAWVVLRQGGLRDDLHRLAARRGVAGWFDPSICLFTELGARWGADPTPSALNEPERHALLASLIDEHGAGLFGRGGASDAWVPIVDRLIGELVSEGVEHDDFVAALAATAPDALAVQRAEVLGAVYGAWARALQLAGRTDGRDAKVRLAATIAADPAGFAQRLGGRRDVRIVGLADLRGGWRPLLDALAASPALDRLELLGSSPLVWPASVPDGSAVEAREVLTFAGALFAESTPGTPPEVLLLEAPDAARETEIVAVRVRRLIDSGVPPTEIAVIAREARPAVDEMAAALTRLGVPVTARRRTALGHTTPGRAITAILRAVGERWSRHSIVELADHPLLSTGLDAVIVDQVGRARAMTSLGEWGVGFRDLLRRCEARERDEDEHEEHRAPLPSSARARAALEAWEAVAPRLTALERSRTLGAWCAWVRETLADDGWGVGAALESPVADADVWRADVRARDQISEIASAWHDALGEFHANGEELEAARFRERFALMLEQDLITPPETDFGVVVAEALAAGWRSFAHLFLVGLSSGAFPRRPVPGPLFDATERRALAAARLALDPVDAWRTREQELFRVICAGARTALTLSWPALDAEAREVARSAYVDEAAAVLARGRGIPEGDEQDAGLEAAGLLLRVPTHETIIPGFPLVATTEALDHARSASARERARTLAPDPWNGLIEDAELGAFIADRCGAGFEWSATQLEQAAKCRWHWFADRLLRLEERSEADELMEPTVRGSILHDALDRFFSGLGRAEAPVFLREGDAERARAALATALGEAWTAMESSGAWLGPEVIRATVRQELLADLEGYLAFEIEYNEKSFKGNTNASKQIRMGVVEGEYAFRGVTLEGNGLPFLLRGSVDRVERGVDERIPGAGRYIAAVDYKNTKYSTPAAGDKAGWDDGIVLQVPLYAAALRHLRPADEVARMEYRTLRSPEVKHQLSLAPVKKGEVQDAAEAEARLAGALDAAGRKIAQLRRGELPADPAPSAGCSPYCPARDVCRIPGGPLEGKR
jgi:RecB family exonuclease